MTGEDMQKRVLRTIPHDSISFPGETGTWNVETFPRAREYFNVLVLETRKKKRSVKEEVKEILRTNCMSYELCMFIVQHVYCWYFDNSS